MFGVIIIIIIIINFIYTLFPALVETLFKGVYNWYITYAD